MYTSQPGIWEFVQNHPLNIQPVVVVRGLKRQQAAALTNFVGCFLLALFYFFFPSLFCLRWMTLLVPALGLWPEQTYSIPCTESAFLNRLPSKFVLSTTGFAHFEVPSDRKCCCQELEGVLYTQKFILKTLFFSVQCMHLPFRGRPFCCGKRVYELWKSFFIMQHGV